MRLQSMRVVGAGIALIALLGACSSSSKKTVATTPPTQAPAATTTTTSPPSKYKETVTPTDNLKTGDEVTVSVSNFTPGKTVGINECSTKTDNTGSGCDLGAIVQMKVGADGTASSKFKVKNGPFGKDNVVCTQVKAPDFCLISVGELIAAANAERADPVKITFAG
jgi:hypothetical protein